MLFAYKALTQDGTIISGEIFAENQATLQDLLKQQKLTLINAKRSEKISTRSLSRKELASLFLKISLLLEAGQTLHKALLTAQESCPKKPLKILLHAIQTQLEQGDDLSTIAENYPSIFTPVLRQYIRLGQKSGNLAEAFKRMHGALDRDLEKQQKIRKMIAYPLILLTMMSVMVGLFMEFLLPQLIEHLHTIGAKDLPFLSKALIQFSQFITDHRLLILGLLGSALCFIALFPMSHFLQKTCTPILFKAPIAGYFLHQHYAQKWLLMVGELYQAGVDFKTCLVEVEEAETNPFIQQKWKNISAGILEGKSLDFLLKEVGLFSPVVIALCEMALQNGTLAPSLLKAYEIEFKDTQHRMEMLIKGMEPGLLILMGAMLLWIVLAVISPLYDFMPG